MTGLPVYDYHQDCPACGENWGNVEPVFDPEAGTVRRGCHRCRYADSSAPRYTVNDGGFLLRPHQADGTCPACGWIRHDVTHVVDLSAVKKAFRDREGVVPSVAFINSMVAFMERAIGKGLQEVMPLLILICRRCTFGWPETPLNHPGMAQVIPLRPPAIGGGSDD